MNEDTIKLAAYRVKRAEESLADAEMLVSKGSINSAVNRYYYAAFYIARAVLATKGLDSSKHSGVISLFQQHFVKTGIIPVEVSKALPRSFEERVDTDYEDFVIVEPGEIERIRVTVKEFIAACKNVLAKILPPHSCD